jgi:hypothetical protein
MANDEHLSGTYRLALKALGVDAPPLKVGATDAEVTAALARRVSTTLAMVLTDLYLLDTRRRGTEPSTTLMEQFANEVPAAIEQQVMGSSGTPVEQLLEALLRAARTS